MASFCTYFNENRCRSCAGIEQDYASQISKKEVEIEEALKFLLPFRLEPSARSPIMGFRNRAKMSVTGTVETPIIGLPGGETDLDQGQELLNCPIHHPKLNALMNALPELIRSFNLIPYQIKNRRGELKGLIAFYSENSNQMYLRFVLRSKECVSRIQKLIPTLQSQFPELVCISANIQPIPHAILEGPEEIILTEVKSIVYSFEHAGKKLELSLAPQAFVQTNSQVATQLYQTAASWIAEAHPEKMLELFCGQGAFSFFAAENAKQILGIEINPDAVKIANETAARLGFSHLNFKCSDAAQVGSEIQAFQPNLILANPPRRGLGESLKLIRDSNAEHFIYSSCSIESLAKDLKLLSDRYRVKKIQLFDLFPHTSHFEVLVWMSKI